jgi:hypothetical protein
MAKKSNRPKAKSSPKPIKSDIAPIESAVESPPVEPTAPRVPRPPKLSRSQAASERLEDEYGFIAGDLWRVFILAAAMFALLIALNVAFNFIG